MPRRHFEIQQVIGQGAFGRVFRAKMTQLGQLPKTVALKVLKSSATRNEDLVARFRDEARILALLDHPSIAHTYGLTELDGKMVVIMQYIDGLDLDTLLTRHQALPEKAAAQLIGQISDALDHALHTKNPSGKRLTLLHRDIKPSNLRLTSRGTACLLDFGVARANFTAREAKTEHLGFGSLGYLPNERIDGISVPRGDIYSLGAVLYELISGKRFGQTFLSPKRHNERMSERTSALKLSGTHPQLLNLIKQMMAFDHEQRPTAAQVSQHLLPLSSELSGEDLKTWGRRVISDTPNQPTDTSDEWVGRRLSDCLEPSSQSTPRLVSATPSPPQAHKPPPSYKRGFFALGCVGVSLIAASAVTFVAAFLLILI